MQIPEPPWGRSLRLFRALVGAARAHYGHVERRTGVGAAEIRLLAAIAENPGAGIRRLAEALALHKATVSNLIGRLERRRLAERRRNPASRREVSVRITAAGRTLLQRVPQPASGLLQTVLISLAPNELVQVEAALALLAARLPEDAHNFESQSLAMLRERNS